MVLACQEERTEHRRMLKKGADNVQRKRPSNLMPLLNWSHRLAVVVIRSHLKIMLMLLEELDLPDKRKQKGQTQT